MTRNRATHAAPPDEGTAWRGVEIVLTLLLLAPASALLISRVRSLTELEAVGAGAGCSGIDTLGPVLHAGLPTTALLVIVPAALLSLGGRARGWAWLALALVGTLLLEMVLQAALPACL